LRGFQKEVHQFITETEEGYWKPLAMFAALVEEVGELGRCINAAEGVKGLKERKEKDTREELKEEMGDVLFALACIANYYGVDLEREVLKSVEKYRQRSF